LKRGALRAEERFGLPEIEAIVGRVEPVSPDLQLFHDGQIPEEAFTHWQTCEGTPRRRLDDRFRDLLGSGATLVLNGMEARSAIARRLSREISEFAGFLTLSNAYVSFGGSGSFGAHWDTHDVVVLQQVGRKRWRVYPPTFPLPLPAQTSRESGQVAESKPRLDIVLEAGDLLYLPRGWWHEVTPLAEPSVHLSVGVYVPSVFDALEWLCRRVLPHELAARRGAIDDTTATRDLTALLDSLRQAVAEPGLLAEFRRELATYPHSR
jgi:ribosomal protein L16 Arg81 hydroxylase